MNLSFLILASFLLNPFICLEDHDIHLSKCSIEYKDAGKKLDMQIHIWLDDLGATLVKAGHPELNICLSNELPQTEDILFKYLQETIEIKVNNQIKKFNWKKKEVSDDLLAVWVHLEIPNISNLKKIEVKNTVLQELYDDQKNMIHIKGANNRQGYLILGKDNPQSSLDF